MGPFEQGDQPFATGMTPGRDATFAERMEAWALTDLQFHWGEAYDISHDGDGWHARRGDGLGVVITAPDPDKLDAAILADYSRRPVPRDAGGLL